MTLTLTFAATPSPLTGVLHLEVYHGMLILGNVEANFVVGSFHKTRLRGELRTLESEQNVDNNQTKPYQIRSKKPSHLTLKEEFICDCSVLLAANYLHHHRESWS